MLISETQLFQQKNHIFISRFQRGIKAYALDEVTEWLLDWN